MYIQRKNNMNKYHDKKGRFASQKVYNKGEYLTTIYPENTMLEVIWKSYGLLIIFTLALSAGLWLHLRANADYCGLKAVQCLLEE